MSRTSLVLLYCFLALGGMALFCAAQAPAPSSSPEKKQKVPVMNGGAGPCSLELTVSTADGKPVYAADVKVHIAYGFAGARKLDLEAGTNSDGKVKFTGLPARVRRPPLEFKATKDELAGTAAYDPATECQAKHDIILEKGNASQ